MILGFAAFGWPYFIQKNPIRKVLEASDLDPKDYLSIIEKRQYGFARIEAANWEFRTNRGTYMAHGFQAIDRYPMMVGIDIRIDLPSTGSFEEHAVRLMSCVLEFGAPQAFADRDPPADWEPGLQADPIEIWKLGVPLRDATLCAAWHLPPVTIGSLALGRVEAIQDTKRYDLENDDGRIALFRKKTTVERATFRQESPMNEAQVSDLVAGIFDGPSQGHFLAVHKGAMTADMRRTVDHIDNEIVGGGGRGSSSTSSVQATLWNIPSRTSKRATYIRYMTRIMELRTGCEFPMAFIQAKDGQLRSWEPTSSLHFTP